MIRSSQQSIQFTASLNLDFRTGAMPGGLTFIRNSIATRFNASGVLETVAANMPRFDYDPVTQMIKGLLIEEARTNCIRNSTMSGAVAGTLGQGGSLPTIWGSINNSGVPVVIAIGTESGINYIDLSYSGSATANATVQFFPEGFGSPSSPVAQSGQSWTHSLYFRSIAGTTQPIRVGMQEKDANNTYLAGLNSPNQAIASSRTRYAYTATLTNSGTTKVMPAFEFPVSSGVAYNFTLRVYAPQMELGAFATSYIPTTNAAVTRAADVCSMSSISSWFNAIAGAFCVEYQGGRSTGQDYRGTVISTGTNAFLGGRGAGNLVESWNGGSTIAAPTSTNDYTLSAASSAVSYDNTAQSGTIAVKGANPQTNSYTGSYIGSTLYIGYRGNNGQWLNGYVRQIRYYPRRLPNSFLQSLIA